MSKYSKLFFPVAMVSFALSGCGYFDKADFIKPADVSRAPVSNITVIPFQGDYQTAHDSVVRNARSCYSGSGQVVKALQISNGAPAQIDVFDKGSSPAEPRPKDLRVKAFFEPQANGGQIKLESFSNTANYNHQANVERFSAWLANQSRC